MKYGNFVSISSLTGECAAEKFKNFCSSSLWTCLHHMVILRSQNKITDFLLILAWASPFNVLDLEVTLVGFVITCTRFTLFNTCISLCGEDHIYTSNPDYIVNHSVPCYAISDHYPVCAIRRSVRRKTKNSCKIIYFRNRKNFNEDLFIYDMLNAPWSNITSLHCADKALAYWSDILKNIVDKHMPIVRKKVRRDSQPNWINDKIRSAIQTRDFHKKKNNFTEYKSWRNKVVQLIKCAKKKFYIEAIETNKKHPKILWKHLKCASSKNTQEAAPVIQIGDDLKTGPSEVANVLNDYFASISSEYIPVRQTRLDTKSVSKISNFIDSKIGDKNRYFAIPPITTDFVLQQLKHMPSTKATGLDDISINVLKLAAPEIVSSITYICNLSLKTATFPAKWKEAKVTPLHKGGSRHNCSNYRPISVLPILSKILEKHVFTHMYAFLQKHNLLTDSQFGFRKQNSCQTALLALTEKMYKAINEGKYFGMTQLDLSKAFDLVNHTILLEKLKLYRCNVESMQWFTSYLESRSQKVYINHYQSLQVLYLVFLRDRSLDHYFLYYILMTYHYFYLILKK